MLIQGEVLPIVPAAKRTGNPNLYQGPYGELVVSELLPRYAALALSGRLYSARSALRATSLVGAAMVGLQLWNRNPDVNLIVVKAAGNIVANSATQTGVALAFGSNQSAAPTGQTVADSVVNNLIGGPAPTALALAAGTFVTAPVAQWDLLHNTAAIATTGEDQGYEMDFEGAIVIPPNAFVAFCALGAAGAASSNNHDLMWVEVPR